MANPKIEAKYREVSKTIIILGAPFSFLFRFSLLQSL
jgi:hypothetical protein